MVEDINNCIIQNLELLTYILSFLIGVIASAVYALIQQLYFSWGAKNSIQIKIEYIKSCTWQLEQALSFGDYRTAVEQADNIDKSILCIYDNIRRFTYGTQVKRKLVNTFLYNVFRYMDQVKMVAIGEGDQNEYKDRCNKLYRYLNNPSCIAYHNWLQDSVYILSLLNMNLGIEKAFSKYKCVGNHTDLLSLIEINTFKSGETNDSFRKDVMTQEEYYKCLLANTK